MVVWTLTGMWHGAAWNFIAWGVYYGVILILEKISLGRVRGPAAKCGAPHICGNSRPDRLGIFLQARVWAILSGISSP